MPSIRETFEPYDPNKPIISIKPKSKEEILQMLLGIIPGGRALKNMHDNPEGPATETLDLLAEDVIPGYYNVIKPLAKGEKVNVNDALKEAVLIGMPVKGKPGKYRINKQKTKEVNQALLDEANKLEEGGGFGSVLANLQRDLAQEKPITWDRMVDVDESIRNGLKKPLKNDWNNVIVAEGGPNYTTNFKNYIDPYSNGGYLGYPKKSIPTEYDVDLLLDRYSKRNMGAEFRKPHGFTDYKFTVGEYKDAMNNPSIRKLYDRDFGQPYTYYGPYDSKIRGMRGLDQEQRQALMDLNKEFERVLTDQSIDDATKRLKLNSLKQEIDFLEAIGDIK